LLSLLGIDFFLISVPKCLLKKKKNYNFVQVFQRTSRADKANEMKMYVNYYYLKVWLHGALFSATCLDGATLIQVAAIVAKQ
jgi:hypothetical protein